MLLLILASLVPSPEHITDTSILELPIDFVLAGQQKYDQGGYDIEDNPPNYSEDIKVALGGGGRLSQADSVFTSTTGNRGYD